MKKLQLKYNFNNNRLHFMNELSTLGIIIIINLFK